MLQGWKSREFRDVMENADKRKEGGCDGRRRQEKYGND